ncbi:MAG TPA: class I SAM-dependent methyltransferase [Haliangiales bacterium]|nr:class I SAM-dependent methyltransferase [Haliangiales bacterium]
MIPADVSLGETYAFVTAALGERTRILDVGCGRGALAHRLAAAGRDVTALDRSLGGTEAGTARLVEGDFLAYRAAPVDALLFVTSLHHLYPLDAAVARAAELLVPGGLVVAEELDIDAPDAATAAWYYDVQEILAAAGLFPRHHVHGSAGDEPTARWRAEHAHDPPLHPGADMLAALGARFDVLVAERGPYLYRYLCGGLEASPRGAAVAAEMLAAERRGIAAGRIRATGLRIVARRRNKEFE